MEIKNRIIDEEILTYYLEAKDFPMGISLTFDQLERQTRCFEGRHVYGVTFCDNENLTYLACVEQQYAGESEQYQLPQFIIPKGNYLVITLKNWRRQLEDIPGAFSLLMKQPGVKKNSISLEDYQNEDEMLLMVQCE